jgi:predicted metal-dependent RNase
MSILKELEKKLPQDASITEVKFEGSEIVLYTKNKDFFRTSENSVRSIVKELKKRVEVRPDLSITMEPEKAKKEIEKIVPEDAGIRAIYFEPELGKVVIESQKPGLVIGKGGETFRKIKEKTFWLPTIERAPVINPEQDRDEDKREDGD